MSGQVETDTVLVNVRNIGGISSQQITIKPGVVALSGRNATNRTSLLRAIAGGFGGTPGPLKSDVDEGEISLEIEGERYTRELTRDGEGISVTGQPYIEDEVLVDTFCNLVRSNSIRQAVERGDGDDLRNAIMRPVDTDQIRNRIASVRQELEQITDRITTFERTRSRMPTLESKRNTVLKNLDEVNEVLEKTRERVDEYESTNAAAKTAEDVISQLQETRGEWESVRDQMATQREAVEALRVERKEAEIEINALPIRDEELASIEEALNQAQQRERKLENTINNLLSVIAFNENFLSGEYDDIPIGLEEESNPVNELDPESESIQCWTCGAIVQRQDIADWIEVIREIIVDKRSEQSDLRDHLADLREERGTLKEQIQRGNKLQDRLASIENEIHERTTRLEELEHREIELRENVDELESEADRTEGFQDSDVINQYQRVSELEYERGQLEEELSTIENELTEIRDLQDELEGLESRQHEKREELASLRTRIEDIERATIKTFNEHILTILELLHYDNIERVWIERRTDGTGKSSASESTFIIHVVRSSDEDTVYEDTIDNLSESERELLGLTIGLAGYLVHDVHEEVPIMLLDSLESIDAERIASLVDYFSDYVPFLIVALLPEDASALNNEDYQHIQLA